MKAALANNGRPAKLNKKRQMNKIKRNKKDKSSLQLWPRLLNILAEQNSILEHMGTDTWGNQMTNETKASQKHNQILTIKYFEVMV